jgi:predicted nucleotidyltransferase
MKPPEKLLADLLPVLSRSCRGSYGIALGGSHAKNRSDRFSDLDVYVFTDAVLPARVRGALLLEALPDATQPRSWGADDPFVQVGTDFDYQGVRIECWFRSAHHVASTLERCLRGEVRREYVAWTVMGFFNHVLLSDLQTMRILADPEGILARWQAAVRVYPEPLRRAILDRFMSEAQFWPENPHYRSGIERADLFYVSGIVQQVVQALIQVLFALNRVYVPGEKNLAAALATLPIRPDECELRLETLLRIPDGRPEDLRAQQSSLCGLVVDVAELVRLHGPAA